MCVYGNKFLFSYQLSNFPFFLKLYFSLIDFFAISLVQPVAGIWDNSLSPEDNQVKSMDWRKTWRSQKPKLDLQMETPKTKGKASSNLFKLHSLRNKYSPHDSRDSALPKPKSKSYWETNVVGQMEWMMLMPSILFFHMSSWGCGSIFLLNWSILEKEDMSILKIQILCGKETSCCTFKT